MSRSLVWSKSKDSRLLAYLWFNILNTNQHEYSFPLHQNAIEETMTFCSGTQKNRLPRVSIRV